MVPICLPYTRIKSKKEDCPGPQLAFSPHLAQFFPFVKAYSRKSFLALEIALFVLLESLFSIRPLITLLFKSTNLNIFISEIVLFLKNSWAIRRGLGFGD